LFTDQSHSINIIAANAAATTGQGDLYSSSLAIDLGVSAQVLVCQLLVSTIFTSLFACDRLASNFYYLRQVNGVSSGATVFLQMSVCLSVSAQRTG